MRAMNLGEMTKGLPIETAERLVSAHNYWASKTLEDVQAEMPSPTVVEVGDRAVKAIIIPPRSTDVDKTRTIVRMAEHMQAHTAGQFMSAAILRDVVAPESEVIMLQNNSRGQEAQTIDGKLKMDIIKRGLVALAEDKMRVLEKLGVENASITGWSMGGGMGVALAAVGSDKVNITHVNSDEPPSKPGRTTVGLMLDFIKSGGYDDQLAAVADTRLPAWSEHFEPKALKEDYRRFGTYTFLPNNLLIMRAMRGSVAQNMERARIETPQARIKIGAVENSNVFQDAQAAELADDSVTYDLKYKHTSVNHPFLQAVMADHGINPEKY